MLETIQARYEAYIEEFRQQERGRKPLEGAFGFGGGPQSHPCYDRFVQDLEALLKEFAAQAPDPAQVDLVLRFLYFTAPARWSAVPAVNWMLLAVHSLTLELIPQLTPSGAEELRRAYQTAYPRRLRLPAQNQLLSALERRAQAAEEA